MPGTNAKSATKALETFRAINEALKSANNEQRRLFRVQSGVALQLGAARSDPFGPGGNNVISKQLDAIDEKLDRIRASITQAPASLPLGLSVS